MNSNPRIHAVIVTFDPDRARFVEQAHRLAAQVACSIIVDNGSSESTVDWLRAMATASAGRTRLVELGVNRGIAAAQNIGITLACEDGADYLLLMDHDSVPAADMVEQLRNAALRLAGRGIRVAAVGPRYLDERQNNPPPFIRVRRLRLERLACARPDSMLEVDYLIASGSLIPRATFDAVGHMQERLFIDYVDIEWGLRARELGYSSWGVCAAQMAHDLGETPIRFMGRALPSHSAIRHYYHFRNAVWLYLHGEVPVSWKLVDAYRLLLRFCFYGCFAKPRSAHLLNMCRGMLDGVFGRLGPARHSS